jgi:hypothetical protein
MTWSLRIGEKAYILGTFIVVPFEAFFMERWVFAALHGQR